MHTNDTDLCHALKLILLLDCVAAPEHKKQRHSSSRRVLCARGEQHSMLHVLCAPGYAAPVGGALGGVDELIGQALCDRLDVAECRLPRTSCQQVDGLQGRTQLLDEGLSLTPRIYARDQLPGSDQHVPRAGAPAAAVGA